jgi:hypothetical protein
MSEKDDGFYENCESACFECGSTEDLTVFCQGVALCPKCMKIEEGGE